MADVGVAAMHHDLYAVGPATLLGIADQGDVASIIGLRQISDHGEAARKLGTAIESIIA